MALVLCAAFLTSAALAQESASRATFGPSEVAALFDTRQELYFGTILSRQVSDYQPRGGCGRTRLPMIHSVWSFEVRIDSVVKATAFRRGHTVTIRSLDEPLAGADGRVFGYATQSCSDANQPWGGVLPVLVDGTIQIEQTMLTSGTGVTDGGLPGTVRLDATSLVHAVEGLVRDRVREDLDGRAGVGLFRVKQTVSIQDWMRGQRSVRCAREYSILGGPAPEEIEVVFLSDCATHLAEGTRLLLPWGKGSRPLRLAVCPTDYMVQPDQFVPALGVALGNVESVLALSQQSGTTVYRR